MNELRYDPKQCITFWFRLMRAPSLKRPMVAGLRVERIDALRPMECEKLTFPQELRWPTIPVANEEHLFEITAALPLSIKTHDQVLFVTLRDAFDRVVARVHVTYTDARMLRRSGFMGWYRAEPAPLTDDTQHEKKTTRNEVTYDELARDESTTFRLVHFFDNGNLYAATLDAVSDAHPSMHLTSDHIDRECFRWAAEVAPGNPTRLLLAGAFRLPVQVILFNTDESPTETAKRTKRDVDHGNFIASILLDPNRSTEYDKLFVACEYASGNMTALEVESLADGDDYTRLAFPDGSDAVYRTEIDKVGARVAVLGRLDLSGHHPAIVMTLVSQKPTLQAGLVLLPNLTVVIFTEKRPSDILLVAWRSSPNDDASHTKIHSLWRASWKREDVSSHSERWILDSTVFVPLPHVYVCDEHKWSTVYLPALLATSPRRLSPRLCPEAINQIAAIVSNRRTRGLPGGYVPLGGDPTTTVEGAIPVSIQRGFHDLCITGLAAALLARKEPSRYAAFW